MSPRSWAALAFSITGIYALINGLSFLAWSFACLGPVLFPVYQEVSAEQKVYFLWGGIADVLLACLLFLTSLILIFRRHSLAARLFAKDEMTGSSRPILGLHAFAYSVVGIVLTLENFPTLISNTVTLFGKKVTLRNAADTVLHPLLLTSLGVALFFGSHGLVRVWSRLRYSGVRRQMGICIHCGYDLTGNDSGNCPECGTPIAVRASIPSQEDMHG